jgi:hypothetical protein
MNKATICLPDEMNRLQYIEDNKMTFEERLRLSFSLLELSRKLSPEIKSDFQDDLSIEWIVLKMAND